MSFLRYFDPARARRGAGHRLPRHRRATCPLVILFALGCDDEQVRALARGGDLATVVGMSDLVSPDLAPPDLFVRDLAVEPDLTSSCSDGVKNGEETGVDCGGPG